MHDLPPSPMINTTPLELQNVLDRLKIFQVESNIVEAMFGEKSEDFEP